MSIQDSKVKVKELKWDGSLASPKFSISFKQSASNEENRLNSFEILSAVKGDNDVVIEVNSSLFNLPSSQRESCAFDFLQAVRDLGLDYRYKKGVSHASQSFFSQLLGGKNNNVSHEIIAYIPDSAWREEGFYHILPVYGARYYITKEPVESSTILEDMSRMLDNEKLDYYKFTIFDACTFGYMGVNSSTLTLDELKRSLGL